MLGKSSRQQRFYIKGCSGNPYHDTKNIFNHVYNKLIGINNFNALYKKIINPIINEYQGEHEDRIKHANKHYMKAINEYDNLRSKALAMRSQLIHFIKNIV